MVDQGFSQEVAFVISLIYHNCMSLSAKSTFFFISTILLLSLLLPANPCPAEIAIMRIHFRDASELLPLVEVLLSPEGKAFIDTRTNAIVVRDRSESIHQIRTFLAESDKPMEQVRIRFRFLQEQLSSERDISMSGKVSGKWGSVTTGKRKREGVSVHVGDKEVNQRREGEAFITVVSGSPAYIGVGKAVPYTERWASLSRRYARLVETVSLQTMETGFEVKPVVAGDLVDLDIVPRISYEERGKRGIIHFTKASTRLTVVRGQWITIGGTSEQNNEAIREILASATSNKSSTLSLSLMVEPR